MPRVSGPWNGLLALTWAEPGLRELFGVLISRLPQHGDNPAALAAGLGKLGDGEGAASLVGAVADVLAGKSGR